MRLARDERELRSVFSLAAAEAEAAFGDSSLYVERFVSRGRHIEVQIVGDDTGAVVHLGDRDCSVQRRHQKVIEEAPAPGLGRSMQERLREAGVAFARGLGFRGIGTVEFLVDVEAEQFFFLEMNPRLQVEHGVTELVTGRDLVGLQLQIAAGGSIGFDQGEVAFRGSAIEARVNAEDPALGFRPMPGVLRTWRPPGGPGVRVDSHCFEGYRIPPHYDSLLAKVMGHGGSRDEAISVLAGALKDFPHSGVATTADLARRIVCSDDFRSLAVSTRWLDAALEGLLAS